MKHPSTEKAPLCLIADLGGTNVRFALYRAGGERFAFEKLECDDYKGLEDAARAYIEKHAKEEGRPTRAYMAVAAPLGNPDHIRLTNRDWSFSPKILAQELDVEVLALINDFMALVMAAPRIPETSLRTIASGEAVLDKPIVILGPGTGLGMAGAIPYAGHWIPVSSEGGHVTFPTSSEQEEKVVRILHTMVGHVSPERILSGPGLVNVYQALATLQRQPIQFLEPDQITQAALDGTCPIAEGTLDLFCGALGTVAANLCLTFCAQGGVYIGGGIVPKVYDLFIKSSFYNRFISMGRFSDYLSGIPIKLIVERAAAFRGLMAMIDDDFYPSGGIYITTSSHR